MNWDEIEKYYPRVTKALQEQDLIGADDKELLSFLEDNGVTIEVERSENLDEDELSWSTAYDTEEEAFSGAIAEGFRFLEEKLATLEDLLNRIKN